MVKISFFSRDDNGIWVGTIASLESQLLEEPSVLAGLVLLLELGSHHVAGLLLLHGVL